MTSSVATHTAHDSGENVVSKFVPQSLHVQSTKDC